MFLLSTLVALLSLSPQSSPAVAWHKNFGPMGRPEIRVASNNVDVRVYASDRKDIEAVLYAERKMPSDSVTDRQSGNRVELVVQVPNQWTAGLSQPSVILELKIPLRSEIDIRSGSGSAMVKGTQGKLAIHTENGNIEARGIRGTLSIESGNGDLQVEGTVTTLSLHARTGNVSAQVNPGSRMNSSWVVQTGNGNVDLLLPADFSADLDVNAGDGNVRLEFPMAMIGGGRQSRIRGPINGGGQHLELHSDKGNIRVRKTAGSV
jgi:Putative adhesin